MIKAVIFDLDGVLVHTDKFHYLAWKDLADQLGIYFDQTINNRCRGVSRMDSLEIVLETSTVQYSVEQKKAFAEQKNTLYRKFLQQMTPQDVSADVRQTLVELKKRNIPIAIGSGSKNTKLILQLTNLDCFDAICDGNDITKGKPNPEVFLTAAKMLGIPPEFCAVVEDSVAGVQAGNDGGFTTVAIGDATSSNLAHHNIASLSDILEILQ